MRPLNYKPKIRRLIHAIDTNMLSNNVFNDLGVDGRNLLKQIEQYKYKITQAKELVADDKSQQRIQKCIDDLDNVSAFVYSFVYDLENYNNVDEYDKQIEYNVPENIDEDITIEQQEVPIENADNESEDIDTDMDPFAQAEENDENFEPSEQ